MQALVGPAMVGQEQQAETDLGDEQRLGQRQQMRDDRPAPRRRARNAATDAARHTAITRNAFA